MMFAAGIPPDNPFLFAVEIAGQEINDRHHSLGNISYLHQYSQDAATQEFGMQGSEAGIPNERNVEIRRLGASLSP